LEFGSDKLVNLELYCVRKKNNYSHLAKTKLIILILIGYETLWYEKPHWLGDVEGFGCELITTMLYSVGSNGLGTILEFNCLCLLLE
jgi:hypothetical protein